MWAQALEWFGRTDTTVTVRPVIDLNQHHGLDRYEISDRPGDQVQKSGPPGTWNGCRKRPPDQLAS